MLVECGKNCVHPRGKTNTRRRAVPWRDARYTAKCLSWLRRTFVRLLVLLSHGLLAFFVLRLWFKPDGALDFTIPLAHRPLTSTELASGQDHFVEYEWSAAGARVAKQVFVLFTDGGRPNGNGLTQLVFAVPYWLLAIAASVLPIWFWFRVRRQIVMRRRAAAGQCVGCGYDVRATPERCPECGAEVTTPA